MRAPDEIVDDLIQRNDGMIGFRKLLTVLLVVINWNEKLKSCKWHAYVDNGGVVHSAINAASRAVDVNQIVGLLCKRLHTMATDLTALRIESKANIGDA